MALNEIMDELGDRENLKNGLSVFGGYLVAGQITSRAVSAVNDQFGDSVPYQIPDEVDGVVTAAAFYGYGDAVVDGDTADMMAIGGLVHSADAFMERDSVKSVLPLGEGEA